MDTTNLEEGLFYLEKQFEEWFEDNLELFGFEEAMKLNGGKHWKGRSPDYHCKKDDQWVVVELEVYPSRFIQHGHCIDEIDYLICVEDNTIFYKDFPKNIKDKLIVLRGTEALGNNHDTERCWMTMEVAIRESEKTNYISLDPKIKILKYLFWMSKDDDCPVCKNEIKVKNKSTIYVDEYAEHVACVDTFMDYYYDYIAPYSKARRFIEKNYG